MGRTSQLVKHLIATNIFGIADKIKHQRKPFVKRKPKDK
mgnify:CR=1 FL=1|jgi:hypothetical protein